MARDIYIQGAKELAQFLKTLPAKLERNIMRASLRAGASVIAKEAKRNAPTDAGDLKRSIRTSSNSQRGTVTAYARAGGKRSGARKDQDAFYANFVEFGTGAHDITPKRASKLRFVARDGRLVTTKLVKHPGYTAKPFMRPAFDSKADDAVKAVAAKIRSRLSAEGINVPLREGSDDVI